MDNILRLRLERCSDAPRRHSLLGKERPTRGVGLLSIRALDVGHGIQLQKVGKAPLWSVEALPLGLAVAGMGRPGVILGLKARAAVEPKGRCF